MQVPYLNGDEVITLVNLIPKGSLKFGLPGHKPVLNVTFTNGRILPVPANLDTLIIEPDDMKVSLV